VADAPPRARAYRRRDHSRTGGDDEPHRDGAGDLRGVRPRRVPAILDRLAQDVAWEAYGGSGDDEGVPWLLRRNGRAGVAEFFASLDAFEFRRFEPLSFLSGADQVAVPVRVELAVKASGFVIEDEEIHPWTFDDAGLVSAFRHVVDTAKHIDAARSLVAAASS